MLSGTVSAVFLPCCHAGDTHWAHSCAAAAVSVQLACKPCRRLSKAWHHGTPCADNDLQVSKQAASAAFKNMFGGPKAAAAASGGASKQNKAAAKPAASPKSSKQQQQQGSPNAAIQKAGDAADQAEQQEADKQAKVERAAAVVAAAAATEGAAEGESSSPRRRRKPLQQQKEAADAAAAAAVAEAEELEDSGMSDEADDVESEDAAEGGLCASVQQQHCHLAYLPIGSCARHACVCRSWLLME